MRWCRARYTLLAFMAFIAAQRALELQYLPIASSLFRTVRCVCEHGRAATGFAADRAIWLPH
jgi:hypothetical protein